MTPWPHGVMACAAMGMRPSRSMCPMWASLAAGLREDAPAGPCWQPGGQHRFRGLSEAIPPYQRGPSGTAYRVWPVSARVASGCRVRGRQRGAQQRGGGESSCFFGWEGGPPFLRFRPRLVSSCEDGRLCDCAILEWLVEPLWSRSCVTSQSGKFLRNFSCYPLFCKLIQ